MVATLTDVISGDEVAGFIVTQVNPDKGIQLVATAKAANITQLTNEAYYSLLAKPGILISTSNSGSGLANLTILAMISFFFVSKRATCSL